jgi:hypothetical protein
MRPHSTASRLGYQPPGRRSASEQDVMLQACVHRVPLEIEGGYNRGVIGLGIFPIDREGGGFVVQDLVVDL